MKLKGIDHIYVLHYFKLTDRLEYLKKFFLENDFQDYTVMYGMEKTCIPERVLELYHDPLQAFDKLEIYHGKQHFFTKTMKLTYAEIANAINHMTAWEKMVSAGHKMCLFIEDDIRFDPDFFRKWNEEIYPQMPTHGMDIAYLHYHTTMPELTTVEGRYGLKMKEGRWWFLTPEYQNRTCASYLLPLATAQQFLKEPTFSLAIDNEMMVWHKVSGHRVYWVDPAPLREASGVEYEVSIKEYRFIPMFYDTYTAIEAAGKLPV